jgi:hypothetical protein
MKWFLVGALLCVTSGSSMAQSVAARQFLQSRAGTTHATAAPQFSDGKLHACIVDFGVLVQDHIYRQGAFVRVGGSFGMMSANNNVAVTLKVIVHDIDDATMQLSPSPPVAAYIVSGTTTTKPFFVAKYPSDTPGALFSIFQLDGAAPILLEGIAKEKMIIAFNRREGGADMQVAIDLTVQDTADDGRKTISTKASQEFLSCSTALLKSMGAGEKRSKR